jgi:uncharacterized DUF497 family protein
MADLRFVWDEAKDRTSRRKHGVAFDEARTVFYDSHAREYGDPDHSVDEDRYLMLGLSSRLRVLVVCHCYRVSESVVRIFSAREANDSEEREYWSRINES